MRPGGRHAGVMKLITGQAWYNENDMLEKENLPKFREIAEEIRNEYLEETFTGFWVKKDKEFGGESLIVFDLSKIK